MDIIIPKVWDVKLWVGVNKIPVQCRVYCMRGHRISECLCFYQQGYSLDWWGDWGWGVCYKSAVLFWRLAGWLASLPCLDPYYVSTALPRDRVFTAMPDLCGQRTAGKCFHSDHSAGLVSEKDFLPLAHTCGRTHTHIYNPYQQCITLLSPTSFKSRNSSTQAHTHTHSQPPPAANKNMKNEDSEMELPAIAQGEFG